MVAAKPVPVWKSMKWQASGDGPGILCNPQIEITLDVIFRQWVWDVERKRSL